MNNFLLLPGHKDKKSHFLEFVSDLFGPKIEAQKLLLRFDEIKLKTGKSLSSFCDVFPENFQDRQNAKNNN